MRQFTFYQRNGIYYVQFRDQTTKKRLPGRSTGKDNRDEALLVVHQWLEKGLPPPTNALVSIKKKVGPKPITAHLETNQLFSEIKMAKLDLQDMKNLESLLIEKGLISLLVLKDSPEAELFETYLERFWTFDASPYVKERLSHKLRIGRTHTKLCLERARKYWIPYFKNKTIGEIQRDDLQHFSNWLHTEYPDASGITLKHIFNVGVTALHWAFANGIIRHNPIVKLTPYSQKTKKRGILKPDECVKLFSLQWNDQRALLANIVAMSTGMRIGEIMALRTEDIGEAFITIRNSYSRFDGLKCTKTDEERTVPIIPSIRDALRHLGQQNPHDNRFIFFCEKPDKPWDQEMPALALKKMLIKMSVGNRPGQKAQNEVIEAWEKRRDEAVEYWKKRRVVFHSWRHFYAAELAKRLKTRQVMASTGHKTEAVFWDYAGHILEGDMTELAQAQDRVFGKLLPDMAIV